LLGQTLVPPWAGGEPPLRAGPGNKGAEERRLNLLGTMPDRHSGCLTIASEYRILHLEINKHET
jgi:hypothetical protein